MMVCYFVTPDSQCTCLACKYILSLYSTDELVLAYGQKNAGSPSLVPPTTATRGQNTVSLEHVIHTLTETEFAKMEPKSPSEIYDEGIGQNNPAMGLSKFPGARTPE